MKVYAYGRIVRGQEQRVVRQFSRMTSLLFKAFLANYLDSLDGYDTFIVEYDVGLDEQKFISMLDKGHEDLYTQVIDHVRREQANKVIAQTVLRAEDV